MEAEKFIATRDGFGEEIVELGRENRDIYVVDVDIGKSCKTGAFAKALPCLLYTSCASSGGRRGRVRTLCQSG